MPAAPLPRATRVKSDVRYLEFFPTIESFHEYWVCFMFCAILCARGRIVSDDWQLPDRFESESLSRNARFLAVDGLLVSPSPETLLIAKAPAARSK